MKHAFVQCESEQPLSTFQDTAQAPSALSLSGSSITTSAAGSRTSRSGYVPIGSSPAVTPAPAEDMRSWRDCNVADVARALTSIDKQMFAAVEYLSPFALASDELGAHLFFPQGCGMAEPGLG